MDSKKSKIDQKEPKVFRPGVDSMKKNQILDFDSSAYKTMNQMSTQFPSLSFDIIPSEIPAKGSNLVFPAAVRFVTGSQAPKSSKNKISLFEVSNLRETKFDDTENLGENLEDKIDEKFFGEPVVREINFLHNGDVNRIRAMPQSPHIVASFSSDSKIYIWNTKKEWEKIKNKQPTLIDPKPTKKRIRPILPPQKESSSISSHSTEGFALSWNPFKEGQIASGDCDGGISVCNIDVGPLSVGKPLASKAMRHEGSVEDIQWSALNENVFGSCSTDKSICLWDLRCGEGNPVAKGENLHRKDINVISWNYLNEFKLVSGSDDSSFKIWDMRNFTEKGPLRILRWHKKPITSVNWNPHDENSLAVSSEDNSISFWDFSAEEDAERSPTGAVIDTKIPPQLMFIHSGQSEIKEVQFHPELKSTAISTSREGFHIFSPDNI